MKATKRFLCIALTMFMLVALLPVSAFATDDPAQDGSVTCTGDANCTAQTHTAGCLSQPSGEDSGDENDNNNNNEVKCDKTADCSATEHEADCLRIKSSDVEETSPTCSCVSGETCKGGDCGVCKTNTSNCPSNSSISTLSDTPTCTCEENQDCLGSSCEYCKVEGAACPKAAKETNSDSLDYILETKDDQGNVTSTTVQTTENGITTTKVYEGEKTEDSVPTKTTVTSTDKDGITTTKEYDGDAGDDATPTKTTVTTIAGNTQTVKEYSGDAGDGATPTKTTVTTYGEGSAIAYCVVTTYDENGTATVQEYSGAVSDSPKSTTVTDKSGKSTTTQYTYNNDGSLASSHEEKYTSGDDGKKTYDTISETTYSTDENGNTKSTTTVYKCTNTSPQDNAPNTSECTKTSETTTVTDKDGKVTTTQYTYNDDGSKTATEYNAEGVKVSETVYNTDGNPTEKTNYDADDNVTTIVTYNVDKNDIKADYLKTMAGDYSASYTVEKDASGTILRETATLPYDNTMTACYPGSEEYEAVKDQLGEGELVYSGEAYVDGKLYCRDTSYVNKDGNTVTALEYPTGENVVSTYTVFVKNSTATYYDETNYSDGSQQIVESTYTEDGTLATTKTTETTKAGASTVTVKDEQNNRTVSTSTTYPNYGTKTTSYTYTDKGENSSTTTTYPNGKVEKTVYAYAEDGTTPVSETTYVTPAGTGKTYASSVTTYTETGAKDQTVTYDEKGNTVSVAHYLEGDKTVTNYANGDVETVAGNTTTLTKKDGSKSETVTSTDGTTTTKAYDSDNKLTSVTTVTTEDNKTTTVVKDGEEKLISTTVETINTADGTTRVETTYADGTTDNRTYYPDGSYTKDGFKPSITQSSAAYTGYAPLVFRSNDDYVNFLYFEVDGKRVDVKYYDAVSGSILVTLSQSYLNTLDAGVHTVSIVSTNGRASSSFSISEDVVALVSGSTPRTGDESQLGLFIVTMLFSASALVAIPVCAKRKEG